MLYVFVFAEIIMSATVWRSLLTAWKCTYIYADGSDCCVICPDRVMLARHMNAVHMMSFDASIRPMCVMTDVAVPMQSTNWFAWDERSRPGSVLSYNVSGGSEVEDQTSFDDDVLLEPFDSSSGVSSEVCLGDTNLFTLDEEVYGDISDGDQSLFGDSTMAVPVVSSVTRICTDEFFAEGRRILQDILQTVRLARAPAPCRYCELQKTACFRCAVRMIREIMARCDDSPCGEFERQLMENKLEELQNNQMYGSGPCVYCELNYVMCGSCWQTYVMSSDLE